MEPETSVSKDQKILTSSDRPISSAAQDEFGVSKFVGDLAKGIKHWTGNDSLVIALHGQWGSGKTSIKNMCLEQLKNDEACSPFVVSFNPWFFSGQEAIYEAFINELSAQVGASGIDDSKEIADGLKVFGLLWKSAGSLVSVGAAVAAYSAAEAHASVDHTTKLVISSQFATVTEKLWNLLGPVGEWIKDKFVIKKEPLSVVALKQHLAAFLEKRSKDPAKRPILVVIDDIDRLTPTETLQIFQLVKSMIDFPSVHYLLLFDRDIVTASISKSLNDLSGREFIRKIVQIELSVPAIDKSKLKAYLTHKVGTLFSETGTTYKFDEERWSYLFENGLVEYFDTPRNIVRYLNTLRFYIGTFVNDGYLEVDPVDLAALEAVRLFEPECYERLYASKKILCPAEFVFSMSEPLPDHKSAATEWLEDAMLGRTTENASCLKAILFQLFPALPKIAGEKKYDSTSYDTFYRQLRIAHARHFSKYFHFATSDDELSSRDLQLLLKALQSGLELRTKLFELHGKQLLEAALTGILDHISQTEINSPTTAIEVLIACADELLMKNSWRVDTEFYLVINAILRKITPVSARYQSLKQAISNCNSIYFGCALADWLGRDSSASGPILETSDLLELRENTLQRLKKNAEEGLLPPNYLMALLGLLKRWGEEPLARSYVSRLLTSSDGLLIYLRSSVRTAYGGFVNAPFSRKKTELGIDALRQYSSLEDIEAAINSFEGTAISADDGEELMSSFIFELSEIRKSTSRFGLNT